MAPRTLLFLLFSSSLLAQDASTGAIRGKVMDPTHAAIAGATVKLTNPATGLTRTQPTSSDGTFNFDLLPSTSYTLTITVAGMAEFKNEDIKVDIGGSTDLPITLRIAGSSETVSVSGANPVVETQPSAVSDVIDERAIAELPLNGRRFTDLVLLTPGVTQDPRGLTASSNGDLAFGGVRGFHSSFLVDGADNNNGLFAQAAGRYRAPFQFSNEVVQEFRVSSNTYGAELGRSGGAVVNVVTKSGSNITHGSLFYYLRDGRVAATHPFVRKKYPDRQHQFGATLSGPLVRNKVFYFAGFDQHIFHIPSVVQFTDGTSAVKPAPADYEATDKTLVFAAADSLTKLAGQFPAALIGSTGFFKLDASLTPHHELSARFNISRFSGANNVFYNSASPITNFAISDNGEERAGTESANLALTSLVTPRLTSHLRAQFSRDLQESFSNSNQPATKINGIINGFGQSSILPRHTRQHRLSFAETLSLNSRIHNLKFGGDIQRTWIANYFPSLFGGEYIFDFIKVNPFTFVPQVGGLELTPLRAYAHGVPHYYIQNFGQPTSHPDTNEFAGFIQDTIRAGSHLTFSLGARYDLQKFRSSGLTSNPLWPDSGKVPLDANNFAPRLGFAASFGGEHRPIVLRGGYGMFFTRIPEIYTAAAETNNGLAQSNLFLNYNDFFNRQVGPAYPAALAACGTTASCTSPANVRPFLTTEISSFAHNFQTPYVQQASLTAEREVAKRTAIGAAFLYVTGKHLIRARDANLPNPIQETYPIFDESGNTFTGDYYTVNSYSAWQFGHTLACPFPPCINDLTRPISQLGAINEFDSVAESKYTGVTISAKRRMTDGIYFRLAYTWAQAFDDGQDALLTTTSQVQTSNSTAPEAGRSVTDQRHRVAFAWSAESHPFHRSQPVLRSIFNNWRLSGIFTAGSGRPVNAKVTGDFNRDGNPDNDRLPGIPRNSIVGPDYWSADTRITRMFNLKRDESYRLEAGVECFNTFNHVNKVLDASDNGFATTAADFVLLDRTIGARHYPGYFAAQRLFLTPVNAYAPRQIQFFMRLKF
jgi:hypothetical protein